MQNRGFALIHEFLYLCKEYFLDFHCQLFPPSFLFDLKQFFLLLFLFPSCHSFASLTIQQERLLRSWSRWFLVLGLWSSYEMIWKNFEFALYLFLLLKFQCISLYVESRLWNWWSHCLTLVYWMYHSHVSVSELWEFLVGGSLLGFWDPMNLHCTLGPEIWFRRRWFTHFGLTWKSAIFGRGFFIFWTHVGWNSPECHTI